MLLRETAKLRACALKRDMKGARWQQSVPGLKAFAWRPESVHGNAKASLLYEAIQCVDSPCFDMPCKGFQRLVSVLNSGRSKNGHDGQTIDWSITQTVIVWRDKYGRTKVRSKRYKV